MLACVEVLETLLNSRSLQSFKFLDICLSMHKNSRMLWSLNCDSRKLKCWSLPWFPIKSFSDLFRSLFKSSVFCINVVIYVNQNTFYKFSVNVWTVKLKWLFCSFGLIFQHIFIEWCHSIIPRVTCIRQSIQWYLNKQINSVRVFQE